MLEEVRELRAVRPVVVETPGQEGQERLPLRPLDVQDRGPHSVGELDADEGVGGDLLRGGEGEGAQ